MGTKYATILTGGSVATYNDSPPSDDGSQTEANRVTFETITSDLTAPLHSGITTMDARIVAHVNEGPVPETGNFTTTLFRHNKVVECTGTITASLLNPAGQTGYRTKIKNAGSGVVTVNVDGGANVDGAASVSLSAGQSATYRVNWAGTAYYSEDGPNNVFGTDKPKMVFYQDTAPTGWTIDAAIDEHSVRLTKGSAAGGQAGGATGGTNNFSTQFASLAEGATPGVGDHTLLIGEIPAHAHTILTYRTTDSTAGRVTEKGNSSSSSVNTQSAGGGGAHGHTVDLRVKWAACIVATKD